MVVVSPHYLVCSSAKELRVYDISTKRLVKEFPKTEGIVRMKSLPDGRFVFGDSYSVNIVDTKDWSIQSFNDPIIDFSVRGNYLAATVLNEYDAVSSFMFEVLKSGI